MFADTEEPRLRVEEFDFDLPPGMIAARPVSPRDSSRLLVVGGGLHDRMFRDLPDLLWRGDILVFNDSRVIPAQLEGTVGGAKVAVTLHKAEAPHRWRAFARPAKRLRRGDRIVFAKGFFADVADKGSGEEGHGGEVSLDFNLGGETLRRALARFGAMPLPPYIQSMRPPDRRDASDYQTVYAASDGAVAAPTAGLHFTWPLLRSLGERGIKRADVTLHVGAGTFLPVRTEFVADHRMHAEAGIISEQAASAVNAARAAGGRVVAVGSTALRLIESAADDEGRLRPFAGETDIFITPGYRFRATDLLLTNFHLPRSTLFILVCAFAGTRTMGAAYEHAKGAGYRFYSYGDGCLLHPEDPR